MEHSRPAFSVFAYEYWLPDGRRLVGNSLEEDPWMGNVIPVMRSKTKAEQFWGWNNRIVTTKKKRHAGVLSSAALTSVDY
jgi:hypothetical protein